MSKIDSKIILYLTDRLISEKSNLKKSENVLAENRKAWLKGNVSDEHLSDVEDDSLIALRRVDMILEIIDEITDLYAD